MKVKWTEAQLSAINTTGRTLLVSAAAGSGKTATLTEKIIRALTSKENRSSLSRMLIVTFTRASAADVRAKISKALSKAIAENPTDTHLYNQMILLGSADISTIDSFCMKPIREHFSECGLPASFRIADEAELNPIKERVLSRLIDEFFVRYATSDDKDGIFDVLSNNAFADFFDGLSSSKSDAKFYEVILKLHENLLNYPEGIEMLKNQADSLYNAAQKRDILLCSHGLTVLRFLSELCISAKPFYENAIKALEQDDKGAKSYLPAFLVDYNFICDIDSYLKEGRKFEDYAARFRAYSRENLKGYAQPPENIVAIRDGRSVIIEAINDYKASFFSYTDDEIYADIARTADMCRVAYDFLTQYDKLLTQEKRERGIVDFTDNKRMLYSLLYDKDGELTPLAKDYASKYDIVFIDEYQDVDEIQDKIFAAIGTDHRFMVGDIKQSIYGFRGAEPTVFAGYRRQLPELFAHGLCDGGNSIFMSENFRCNLPIIKSANAVCSHIFQACPQTIGYTADDDLKFSKVIKNDSYVQPKVQFDVILPADKKKKDDADLQADLPGSDLPPEVVNLANRISELLRGDYRLESGERIKPSDITVLVRKRSAIPTVKDALISLNIPTEAAEIDNAEAGQDLLHSPQMIYLVNLLRVINNPSNDIPLLELLGKTPLLGGFELEEIVRLRNKKLNTNEDNVHGLYYSVKEYARSGTDPALAAKCRAFVEWLEGLRRLASTHSAEELLNVLRTDESCYCGTSDAFMYMYEKARTYRRSSFVGLYNFLAYFENLLTTEKHAVEVSSSDGGRVSVMTIHNSKGLEFPVCFIYSCGTAFSTKSTDADLIFLRELGISMTLFHRSDALGSGYKKNTLLRNIARKAIIMRDREAEMQSLYVAMTRAREYLFMSATPTKASKAFLGFDKGDRFRTLACSAYSTWILTGLEKCADSHEFCDVNYIQTEDVIPAESLPTLSFDDKNAFADSHFSRKYKSLAEMSVCVTDEEKFLRSLPTKAPASKIADDMLDRYVFFNDEMSLGNSYDSADVKDAEISFDDSGIDYKEKAAVLENLRLMQSSVDSEFDLLLMENSKASAAQKGTAAHAFLQFCDFEKFKALLYKSQDVLSAVNEEIERLCLEGFIDRRSADILDAQMLSSFFKSDFFGLVAAARSYQKELRFNRFVPLSTLTRNPATARVVGDRTLYIQGSIDLVLHTDGGEIILCDYKSDRITDMECAHPELLVKKFSERHSAQLKQYSKAVFDLYGKHPAKIFIYSLPLGEAVEIDIK